MSGRQVRWTPNDTIIGSSTRIAGRVENPLKLPGGQSWQNVLWDYYDMLGELSFGATWVGNALSRMRLFAATTDVADGDPTPIDDPDDPAVVVLRGFGGGAAGQSEILKQQGVHLSIPGETWLVGEPSPDGNLLTAKWMVVTRDELDSRGGTYRVQTGDSKWRDLHPDSIISRTYRSHPRRHWEAWSPNRAALPILAEIRLLSQHIYSSAQSRLKGAGVWMLPSEMSSPTVPGPNGTTLSLPELIGKTMMAAVGNPESPEAVVPIILQGPGEHIGNAHLQTFDTPFDERVLELREAGIRRYAATIDLPAEVLLGIASLQHWNAWAVSEQAQTLHIEPLMTLICQSLTDHLMHPVLDAMGEQTVNRCVWYDASELAVQGDQSADAVLLFDRGLLAGGATRRAARFDDGDAPTDEERRVNIILSIVKASPTLAPSLLPAIGIDLPVSDDLAVAMAAPSVADGVATEPVTEPSGVPSNGKPSMDTAIVAACDGVVYRAMERAGARLRTLHRRTDIEPVLTASAADSVHCALGGTMTDHDDLLRDAWLRIPDIAARHGRDPVAITATLDAYTRALLAAGEAHTYERLAACLHAS